MPEVDTSTGAAERPTHHRLSGAPRKRSAEFMRAWRAAIKYAVTWMHGHAEGMNDPHAYHLLHGAAFDFGQQMKRAWEGDPTLAPELLVSSTDLTIRAGFLARENQRLVEKVNNLAAERDALLAVARAARELQIAVSHERGCGAAAGSEDRSDAMDWVGSAESEITEALDSLPPGTLDQSER